MPMKNPPHPGLSVRLNCLEPFGLSVTEGAKALGVSRTTLSRLMNGRARVSPGMAIRLAKAFGATPDIWMRMQAAYVRASAGG
jgi:antitoxin HigA-1